MLKEKLEAVYNDMNSMNQRITNDMSSMNQRITGKVKDLTEEVGSVKATLNGLQGVVSENGRKMDENSRKMDQLLAMWKKPPTEHGHGGCNEQKETPGFPGNQASISLPNDNNLTF